MSLHFSEPDTLECTVCLGFHDTAECPRWDLLDVPEEPFDPEREPQP